MDTIAQDVRYALRGFVKTPGFTALAVLSLALGIGVNGTIFSIADTVALRPLPFTEPHLLGVVYSTQPSNAVDRSSTSYQDFRDWKARARGFSELGGYTYRSISLTDGVETERFQGSAVTWNLFPMLGVHAVLGRDFREEDDRPGAPPVVMLSDGVWQRRYGRDPAIIGRTLMVDNAPHTVVGVMPPRFQFPQIAELWIPVAPVEYASPRTARTLIVVGRLSGATTLEAAGQDVARIEESIARGHRENDGWSARVVPLRDELMPVQLQVATVAMVGAVSLVLLIACANVANLLLARATARQREMAVRTAIGAGRWRIVRQLLTESVLLGLLSAPLGVAIAYMGLDALIASTPPSVIVPYYVDWSMNGRVIAYAVAVFLATGLVFGLAPALHASGSRLFAALKDGGRGSGGGALRNRLRNALVVSEVALSLVLLVGASLFVRSFLNIQGADTGVESGPLLTLRFLMAGEGYDTPEAMTRRVEDVVRRVEAIPGVTAALASNFVPLSSGGAAGGIVPEGMAVEAGREPRITFFATTSHALTTLDVPLLSGRDFTHTEASTRSGTAIVTQALARRMWAGQSDIIGRRFRFTADPPDQWLTVIGLVADFQAVLLRDKDIAEPLAILPYPYQATRDTGLTIRVAGQPPASITSAVRRAIGQSDPSLALFNVRTGEENRAGRFYTSLLMSWMFSIFGAVALFLAAIGIYGVLSYSVAQRTQEIGVRVALGASRRNILSLVLGQGARLALVGIALGAAGAFLATRLIRTILYNVTPTDPLSFAGTAVLLAAVALLAGYIPARRATTVDPIVALRGD